MPTALETLPPRAHSYDDMPILKAPVWTWEVPLYFFFAGLSGGSYVLARTAARIDPTRFDALHARGTLVAFAAALPCAPLLVNDLGVRRRFHHMLRVFKPRSPMSLGAWTLTAHAGLCAGAVLERLYGRTRAGSVLLDALGVPTALLLLGYTGVLLSGTTTPVWSRSPWLGPLFTASGFGTAATVLESAAPIPMRKVASAAHAVEAVALAGYAASKGRDAAPLIKGRHAAWLAIGVGGVAASEALKSRRPGVAAALGLAGAVALRWAFVFAGRPSARVSAPSGSPSPTSRPTGSRRIDGQRARSP